MSIAGVGSASGSVGTQYDFTKMTNSDLLDAAHQLGSEGKISLQDEAQLVGIASGVDNASPDGNSPTVSDYLSSSTQTNFLDYLRQDVASADRTGQTKTADLYGGILNDLLPYQATEGNSVGETGSSQKTV